MTTKSFNCLQLHYVDNIVNTIGRKRILLILLQLGEHKKLRYKEISSKLGTISPSTLSSLLNQLRDQGLIKKRVFGETPPRSTEYSLTKDGLSLLTAIDPLFKWVCKQKNPKTYYDFSNLTL